MKSAHMNHWPLYSRGTRELIQPFIQLYDSEHITYRNQWGGLACVVLFVSINLFGK